MAEAALSRSGQVKAAFGGEIMADTKPRFAICRTNSYSDAPGPELMPPPVLKRYTGAPDTPAGSRPLTV